MRVLFDTNVVLDVLLKREPWAHESTLLWEAADSELIEAWMSASAITDVFYVVRRKSGAENALAAVKACLEALQISAVDNKLLNRAVLLPSTDFEDNLQIVCAAHEGLDAIITRDKKGFTSSSVPALTPTECLLQLNTPPKTP
jgi:predicted nucleic acid-binding protein